MAEYITKEEAVLTLLEKGQSSHRYKLGDIWELNFEEIREVIASIPAVDVKPVVRCKDCRYSRKPDRYDRNENKACEGVLVCCVGFDHVYPSSDDGMIFVDENWFCADGKKREES